jgi:hypothetical protein
MNWNYFAQINSTTGICEGITQTTGTIVAPNIVPITANQSVLGKRWTGTAWVNVPPPEPPAQ